MHKTTSVKIKCHNIKLELRSPKDPPIGSGLSNQEFKAQDGYIDYGSISFSTTGSRILRHTQTFVAIITDYG